MNTNSSAPTAVPHTVWHSWAGGSAALKHWWAAYIAWRIEWTAIDELRSMSDLELKDIGLSRSEITGAVRYGLASRRPFVFHV